MFSPRTVAAFLAITASALAQSGTYSVRAFAGSFRAVGDGGPATSAILWSPRGVSLDAAGNLYIADTGDARIRKVAVDGTITTVAGFFAGYSGDGGSATSAYIAFPSKAVAAPNGDIYIADSANNRIRRISSSGIITTVAGTGQAGFSGDSASATAIQLSFPRDIAVDPNGNVFIADTNNTRIRRLTPQGAIATVAGSGAFGFFGDQGAATGAQLASPRGVAIDSGGAIYIADTLNHRIRKIAPDGTITTIAGGNQSGFGGDGSNASFARLNSPSAIAVDRLGNIYFTDTGNQRVRKINGAGVITTIAGTGAVGFSGDGGQGTSAQLNFPQSIAVDSAGNVYIADTENNRVRKIDTQGIITTVAGSNTGAGDGGLAASARLFQPSGVALDGSGNVYIADTSNHRVRMVNPQGVIQTVAGNGTAGYSGDGRSATLAQLSSPVGLAVDRSGALYIADQGNHAIRKVSSGVISTVAGTGLAGTDGDGGLATAAMLFNPSGVAFDKAGTLYIADSGNNRIRVISGGIIRNFAGDAAGFPAFSGDNGPAAAAGFNYPIALAFDDLGNLYVSDYFNNRIRKITVGGTTITTFAGTGVGGALGDGGPATQAQLDLPAGLAFDSNRTLYVADLLNNRVRTIASNGVIRTIAGGVRNDYGDGGPALDAAFLSPRDVAVDASGNVYVVDQEAHRVRKLTQSSVSIRSIVNAASGVSGAIAPGEAITIYGSQLGADVTFDGIPALTLYSSPTQVNVIVPRSLAGRTLTQLRVTNPEFGNDIFALNVQDAAPGIFTIGGSGSGQAAIVNQNGTINSTGNPAPPGTIIAIYGTGNGVLNNAIVRIQGQNAEVLFAGETAPGLYQVNARVPSNAAASDRATIELLTGSFAAQTGTTVVIR